MRTVRRADLADAACRVSAASRADAADVVDQALAAIADTLVAGDTVKIANFGSWDVRRKAQRIGRNPLRPEEEHVIAPRRVAVFHASLRLRALVAAALYAECACWVGEATSFERGRRRISRTIADRLRAIADRVVL